MKILAIIPARGGSKGVPKKNIRLLGGKPLLQHTSDIALKSKFFDDVILSTDSEEIAQLGVKLGLRVPFLRPKKFATDTSPMLPVISHVLNYIKQNENIIFDAVCLLQVTTPFRTLTFIEKAIEKFVESKADSLISVQKVPHQYNPHWVFKEDNKGSLKIATGENDIITRRQDLPNAFYRDGSIYLTKTNVILNKKSLYGSSISFIESSQENYVNIDTMNDWKKAEEIVNSLN